MEEKHLKKRITEPTRFCFVAELDKKIVGYVTGSRLETHTWRPIKRMELENLIIAKNYRGQKIGEKLTEAVCDLGRLWGVERVMVAAYAKNKDGLRFYERIGFTPDNIQFEKEL